MKMKKIIALGLLAIMSASMTSCSFADFSDTDKEPTETAQEDKTLLMGFESVRELLTVYTVNVGQIYENKDAETISQGETSMKVSYQQEVGENDFAANMEVVFMPGNKYFKKVNFEDVSYLSIDVYNPNDRDYEVCVNNGGISTDFFVVKPGWNTLTTYLDRSIAKYRFNGAISYYSLMFRGQQGQSPDFYVDNFRYYEASTSYDVYSFDKDKEIWHEFTNSAETTFLVNMGVPESVFSTPRYTINKNPKYVLTGKSSLKVEFLKKSNGAMDITAFRTADNMMGDLNSYLNKGDYYLFFDIYNDFDYSISVGVIVFSNYNNETYGATVEIAAKSWSNPLTSRIYLKDMEAAFTGNGLDCMTIAYYINGVTSEGCIYLDSIGVKK